MIDRDEIHEGMMVRSADGKNLGRVLACGEASFIVEKGFYFATDYVARYDDVTDISGDKIRLSRPQDELAHGEHTFPREGGLGESFTVGIGSGLEASVGDPWARAEEEEEEARRGGVRGDEDEPGPRYAGPRYAGSRYYLGPPSYGDEGGGGLL